MRQRVMVMALAFGCAGFAANGLVRADEREPSQAVAVTARAAQTPTPDAAGRGGRGGGQGSAIPVMPFSDRTGFESMFNGRDLAGTAAGAAVPAPAGGRGGRGGGATFETWDGDPTFWRVEGGVIVGESTPEKVVNPNTFLIWRGGTPGDFELKAEIRMNSTNSGIQYRSRPVPANQGRAADSPGHAWRLGGYQMDLDHANRFPGAIFEEQGRGFLATRGMAVYIAPDGTKSQIGTLQTAEFLASTYRPGEWNQFHIIARGNSLVHVVNGHVTAVLIDDDAKGRSMGGLIGLQLHSGAPMKLEVRNIAIKLR
jgi:hypothetical protein